jgi:uncharacterized metal-binding protein
MESESPHCAVCPFDPSRRVCRSEDGEAPPFCPTVNEAEMAGRCLERLDEPELGALARASSVQEGEAYADRALGYDRVRPAQPRLAEIASFARMMGYRKLGLAFCVGLRREAKAVEEFYGAQGFEVVSVMCKAGGVPKERIGVRDEQKVAPGTYETMCNPVFQAEVMNREGTDLNVVLGLCVGHDSLFFRFAKAPCTVLAVKDRLLGHNPLAAVYTLDSYYRYLKAAPDAGGPRGGDDATGE